MVSFTVTSTGKNFCILPWISLETTPVGTVHPCCAAQEEIISPDGTPYHVSKTPLLEIANSKYMRWLRQEFKADKRPTPCQKCWTEEDAGRTSKRQHSLQKFKDVIPTVDTDAATVDHLAFLDLKLGNICNLKCRICGPWSSSKWASEDFGVLERTAGTEYARSSRPGRMLKEGRWPRRAEMFWQSIETLLPNVLYFEFTGGEPFLIDEHTEILQTAINLGYAANIHLHYNTNATVYNARLEYLWSHFRQVDIALSIDNTGDRFEYERDGAKWSEVTDNVARFVALRDQSSNIKLQLCFTVSLFNVLYLNQLLAWADGIGFDSYYWNVLSSPAEFAVANQDAPVRSAIISVLRAQAWPDRHRGEVDGLISQISAITDPAVPGLTTHAMVTIHSLDNRRDRRLATTHPDLEKIIDHGRT